MKVTITGSSKEIAALAAETQRRQMRLYSELMTDKSSEAHKALIKAIHVLRDVRFENSDPATPDSQ